MATLYVFHACRAEWSDDKRIECLAGTRLDESGAAIVREVATDLSGRDIGSVHASESESDQQTAEIIGNLLGARCRIDPDLHEFDYGLWQGLLLAEIKQRHAKLYRQWREAPITVRPPGGETFAEAQDRICKAIDHILKRHHHQPALAVLHPVAAGLLKCRLDGLDTSAIWKNVDWIGTWTSYELDRQSLEATS